MGASVALLEETDWIGGQSTAAGVSTMDEAGFNVDSGIYFEFTTLIRAHYYRLGKSVGTCASSTGKTCFEPSVGQKVLYQMIESARLRGKLDLMLRTRVQRVISQQNKVVGIVTQKGEELRSKVLIDATEYGDVLPLTPARYRTGKFIGGKIDPSCCTQDITYTAVVKKYPKGVPPELQMKNPPPGYTDQLRQRFAGYVKPGDPRSTARPWSWPFHNRYRGLPDSSNPEDYNRDQFEKITKTGINFANDWPATLAIFDRGSRRKFECDAKLRTLQFLYYMQHDLGEKLWAIANDEGYDTPFNREENSCANIPSEFKAIERNFPVMAYVRESHRLIGVETIAAPQLQKTGIPPTATISFPSAIAVGDYPMDLHRCDGEDNLETTLEHESDLQPFMKGLGPFQVPWETLIPESVDGLLVAEKNLSQSRFANGATRLQPITMLTGQAAGITAALAAKAGIEPRKVNYVQVQKIILATRSTLALRPYPDLPKPNTLWPLAQLMTVNGLMTAEPDGAFAAERQLNGKALNRILGRLSPTVRVDETRKVTRIALRDALKQATGVDAEVDISKPDTVISRGETARILSQLLDLIQLREK